MSIEAKDIADVLPGFLKARAEGDSFFSDIVVLVIDPGATESDVMQKLAVLLGKGGKLGIALLILPITEAFDDEPNADLLKLSVVLQVVENRLLNKSTSGTNKTGYSVARRACALFKKFSVQGICKLLIPDSPFIARVPPPETQKTLRVWSVNFTTREDDNFVTPKVALPAMTPARGVSGTVALACGTASAAIYYTTNGTPPQASNNAAILYTVPITVPPGGFTLFVGAFKTDYFPSNVISASFTPT